MRTTLRIAQVAPLYESVPPRLYGGTERVVSWLTEELVRQGHDVTLFASGDSTTSARLIAPCARALRLSGCADPLPHHIAMLEHVHRYAHDFDIIHFHIDYLHYPSSRRLRCAQLTTLHGRLDLVDLLPLYAEFCDVPVASISKSQRDPLPNVNWVGNIHHGMPADLYELGPGGDYLAFVGRVSPEKRLDRAIEIAEAAGLPLRIAAKVDRNDLAYYTSVIEPLLSRPCVEFLGEIGYADKRELLRNARALLFPIDWPEPFGIVMIEAMACGTPVVAFDAGSVREVIDDGVTGYIVDTSRDAIDAISRLDGLHRPTIRSVFESKFTSARMAHDYIQLYRTLIHIHDARTRSTEPGLSHLGHELARG